MHILGFFFFKYQNLILNFYKFSLSAKGKFDFQQTSDAYHFWSLRKGKDDFDGRRGSGLDRSGVGPLDVACRDCRHIPRRHRLELIHVHFQAKNKNWKRTKIRKLTISKRGSGRKRRFQIDFSPSVTILAWKIRRSSRFEGKAEENKEIRKSVSRKLFFTATRIAHWQTNSERFPFLTLSVFNLRLNFKNSKSKWHFEPWKNLEVLGISKSEFRAALIARESFNDFNFYTCYASEEVRNFYHAISY